MKIQMHSAAQALHESRSVHTVSSLLTKNRQTVSGLSLTAGGSKEADRHVRAAIKTALTPAALATSEGHKAHKFQLNYCTRSGVNMMESFAKVAHDLGSSSSCVYDHSVVWEHGCLCAVWPQAQLDMEYDMKIMAEPEEHKSAAKDILDGDYLRLNLLHDARSSHVVAGGCTFHKLCETASTSLCR